MMFGKWGEFDAFLALRHFLDSHSESMKVHLNTKKKYAVFIESLLDRLCKDKVFRDEFMSLGGNIEYIDIDETGKLKQSTHNEAEK